MPQKQNLTPKFFFLSLGVLASLITSVISGLSLFFKTLDKFLPDILTDGYGYGFSSYDYQSLRTSLATLIIAFPVYLVLSYFWNKEIKKGLENKATRILKWLVNLILFLAIIVFAIDLITLVRYFVSGETTLRFIIKVIATAFVAGLVWIYYYFSLKDNYSKKVRKIISYTTLIISIIIFILFLAFSFKIIGTPSEQRALRLDEERISNLQNIEQQIVEFYAEREKLPVSLEYLAQFYGYYGNTFIDPEFSLGKEYEYYIKDELSFELCADFSTNKPDIKQERFSNTIRPIMNTKSKAEEEATKERYISLSDYSYEYSKGRTCFERSIVVEN